MPDGTFESSRCGNLSIHARAAVVYRLASFWRRCKQSWWLLGVLITIALLKLFENWIYTKIGQLQRELMQIDGGKEPGLMKKLLVFSINSWRMLWAS